MLLQSSFVRTTQILTSVLSASALVACASSSPDPSPAPSDKTTTSQPSAPSDSPKPPSNGNGSTTSGGAAGPSGVVSGKAVADLSDEEVSTLCDWQIEVSGGPGHVTQCSAGTSRVSNTKAECREKMAIMKAIASCLPLTVGQLETCAIEEAKDPCADTCKELSDKAETCAGKD